MQTASNAIKQHFSPLIGVLGLAAVGVWLWRVVRQAAQLREAGAALRPDEALTAVVAAVALLGTAWLLLAAVVGLLARLPGRLGRAARVVAGMVTPVLVRRTLGLLLGAGLGAGVAAGLGPADAAAAHVGTAHPRPDPGRPDSSSAPVRHAATPVATRAPEPDPGWVPAAPTVRPQPDVRVLSPSPRSQPAEGDTAPEVVVRRGDSLWSIAARFLGPDPSEAEIAQAWPAWYAANREVIGPDPDLLLPGQVLRAPEVARP